MCYSDAALYITQVVPHPRDARHLCWKGQHVFVHQSTPSSTPRQSGASALGFAVALLLIWIVVLPMALHLWRVLMVSHPHLKSVGFQEPLGSPLQRSGPKV